MTHRLNFLRPAALLAAAALYGSSLACSSLSSREPTPTGTPRPTPTERPTATAEPVDAQETGPTSPEEWPAVLSDSFDDNANDWLLGDVDDEYITGDVAIADGRLTLDVTAKRSVFWWLTPDVDDFSDVFVSVDAKKIRGAQSADLGLVFRQADDEHYYYFSIYPPTGEYQLAMFIEGEWTTLIEWAESDLIDSGGPNRLAVLAQGPRITLFVNGEEVDGCEDSTVEEGEVGVGFSLYEEGETLKASFDNFEVRAP
jgi:hypothetical protein